MKEFDISELFQGFSALTGMAAINAHLKDTITSFLLYSFKFYRSSKVFFYICI